MEWERLTDKRVRCVRKWGWRSVDNRKRMELGGKGGCDGREREWDSSSSWNCTDHSFRNVHVRTRSDKRHQFFFHLLSLSFTRDHLLYLFFFLSLLSLSIIYLSIHSPVPLSFRTLSQFFSTRPSIYMRQQNQSPFRLESHYRRRPCLSYDRECFMKDRLLFNARYIPTFSLGPRYRIESSSIKCIRSALRYE